MAGRKHHCGLINSQPVNCILESLMAVTKAVFCLCIVTTFSQCTFLCSCRSEISLGWPQSLVSGKGTQNMPFALSDTSSQSLASRKWLWCLLLQTAALVKTTENW